MLLPLILVVPAFWCFFLVVRDASEEMPLDEVLCIAVGASLVWPLTLLYLLAIRPPAAERRAAARVRLAELNAAEAQALAERERALGIGPQNHAEIAGQERRI